MSLDQTPSRYAPVTLNACLACGAPLPAVGRRRFCSSACRQRAYRRRHGAPADLPALPPSRRSRTVYECGLCGERSLGEQRCEECNTFRRRLGLGGECPHCAEPVTVADILDLKRDA